jgi:hypothetical protein
MRLVCKSGVVIQVLPDGTPLPAYLPAGVTDTHVTVATYAKLLLAKHTTGRMPSPQAAAVMTEADWRLDRSVILPESDWLEFPSSTAPKGTTKEAWLAYRQAWRDITTLDPNTAQRPVPPVALPAA